VTAFVVSAYVASVNVLKGTLDTISINLIFQYTKKSFKIMLVMTAYPKLLWTFGPHHNPKYQCNFSQQIEPISNRILLHVKSKKLQEKVLLMLLSLEFLPIKQIMLIGVSLKSLI